MRSYSETNLFKPEELKLIRAASLLVEDVVDRGDKPVRCHELARAVGLVLKLPFQDGFYGFVEHTWLWTSPLLRELGDGQAFDLRTGPSLLDVYCVGRLPMVSLIDCEHTQLPHLGWSYRPSSRRKDIDHALVKSLATTMRELYSKKSGVFK